MFAGPRRRGRRLDSLYSYTEHELIFLLASAGQSKAAREAIQPEMGELSLSNVSKPVRSITHHFEEYESAEASLIVAYFTCFVCTAVHVILSLLATISLLCFLSLVYGLPKVGRDAKKYR